MKPRWIFAIVIASTIVFLIPEWKKFWLVDACLDDGGAFDYQNQTCYGVESSDLKLREKISTLLDPGESILEIEDLDEDIRNDFRKSNGSARPGLVCGKFDDTTYSCGVLTRREVNSTKVADRLLYFKDVNSKNTSGELVENFRDDQTLRNNIFLSLHPKDVINNRGEGPDKVEMSEDGFNRTIEGQSNMVVHFTNGKLTKTWTSD